MNAAEQSGRKAFLMELGPLYCDVILQCFEQLSGEKGQRLSEARLIGAGTLSAQTRSSMPVDVHDGDL
jgi:hypothetical protein